MSSTSFRLLAAGLLAVLALASPASAGLPLDLDGSSWQLPEVAVRSKGKVQALGKAKTLELDAMTITLGEGDTWTGELGDAVLSGTYTRKKPNARVLHLELDQPGRDALEASQEALAEDLLAAQGFPSEVALTVWTSKLTAKVSTQGKAGTARLKLKGKLTFRGSVKLPDTTQLELRVKARVRGKSLPVPLDGLLAD